MEKLCDLHTHSTYSDGTCTPRELCELAVAAGLSAIALTDHNSVDGIPDFLSVAKDYPIEAIAGSEFSVDYNGKEVHLVGLFIPTSHFAAVTDLMAETAERKERSNVDLVAALRAHGMDVDYDVIKSATPTGRVNRALIAAEMLKKGYVSSVKEAFSLWLSPARGLYKEPERISIREMLDVLGGMGATPVLAHPFLSLTEEELTELLPLAKEHGLVGMECAYTTFDEETTAKAFALADRFGLAYSGGSDFHGEIKPLTRIGVGEGNLKIPYAWLDKLRP